MTRPHVDQQPARAWPVQDWPTAPGSTPGPPSAGRGGPGAQEGPVGAYADLDAPTTELRDPVLVEPAGAGHLRRAAIERMARMNLRHARNAWEQRRSDPIAPHALGLLFAQPDERAIYAGRWRLYAGWRLWVDGHDARDLPDRLYQYHHELAQQLAHHPIVDLRTLATKRDKEMHDGAVYVGLGVSSLDTPTGSWANLLTAGMVSTLRTPAASQANVPETVPVRSDTDIPGTVHILLADGTVISVQRRGMPEFDHQVICSTGVLGPHQDSPYPWTHITTEQAHRAHGPVLEFMGRLHDLFTQLDQARLTTTATPPAGRARPRGVA